MELPKPKSRQVATLGAVQVAPALSWGAGEVSSAPGLLGKFPLANRFGKDSRIVSSSPSSSGCLLSLIIFNNQKIRERHFWSPLC